MKTSLIVTIFNEEKGIELFLDSISKQSVLPDEVIIVDGGSKDHTLEKINNYQLKIARRKNDQRVNLKVYVKNGNRSVGRNEAIKRATGDVILITDAGCFLEKNWVEEIQKPFSDKSVDVVAGYYASKSETIFQKCLTPYALVMPDRVIPTTFLPATRSMAVRKTVWQALGGFDEHYSHNEDYVFARKLKDEGKKIIFVKDAIVYWVPRKTFKEAFVMFYRFALGDMEADIVRGKVLLLYARYFLLLYLLSFAFILHSQLLLFLAVLCLGLYGVYSIAKNWRYVRQASALYLLPLIQLTADTAVITGSTVGFFKKYLQRVSKESISKNKWVLLLICAYVLSLIPSLAWGTPNAHHPFFYQMDEWHGVQSVRYLFTEGTINKEGAAYGMAFFYYLSGLFLLPFTLLGLLNPFEINSSIGALGMQERLAIILRLSTLFYGVGSILLIVKIVRDYSKGNALLTAVLFTITPIWLTLSTLFKYDIAVIFWILLTFLFSLRYKINPATKNLIYLSVVSALSITVKISALPTIAMFVLAYLLFTPKPWTKFYSLILSSVIFIVVVIVFGMPDITTHFIDYYNLLHLNIVDIPIHTSNYLLQGSVWQYLILKEYPAIFGHFYFSLSCLSFVFLSAVTFINLLKSRFKFYRTEVFVIVSTICFITSLIPLHLGAGGNRALVLLPFTAIIISLSLLHLKRLTNNRFMVGVSAALVLGLTFQTIQSFGWLSVKYYPDPRQVSSNWMLQNIPLNTEIGIENIPIYQMLPDVIVSDFYVDGGLYPYRITVIGEDTKVLPDVVIVTGGDSIESYLKESSKITLLQRLKKEGFVQFKRFTPNFTFYDQVGERKEFVLANLIPMPTSIVIYQRQVVRRFSNQ